MTGRNRAGAPGPEPAGTRRATLEASGRELIATGPTGPEGAFPSPSARRRTVRWAAALLALLTVAATAACAGPPSKGDVHGALLNQSHNNVVVLAREPSPEMPPGPLVESFLQALTGDQKDPAFSVAQEYLTPDARAKWIPAGSTWVTTTKIVDYRVTENEQAAADHGAHASATPSATPQAAPAAWTPGEVRTVTASGPEIAQVDKNGFFQYLSGHVEQTFSVKYLGPGTGWRIAVPPDFRMVTPEAFKRAYQTYQSPLPVYLPASGTRIPHMDQVYLTQATGKVDDMYDALARAVLHGRYPWQDTEKELLGPVTVDAGQAVVTLKVPQGGMPNIEELQRALFLTFQDASQMPQLLSPTPLSSVLVTYAGCKPSVCQVQYVVPGGAASSAVAQTVYWVCPQGQNDAAIVSRQVTGSSAPTACPANGAKVASAVGLAGVRLQKNSPIAVKQSPDPSDQKMPGATTTAAVVKENGDVVVVNDKNADPHTWYVAGAASNVTDLEWDPVDGALWVVDDNTLFRVQDPGDKPPSSDSKVSLAVPGSEVTRFKPSPDGLRAVVVGPQKTSASGSAGGPQPPSMVTIDRGGGSPTLSTDTEFQLLAGSSQNPDGLSPAPQSVQDATWTDGRTVELLGVQNGSSTPKLYKVYLDGSQDSTIFDPDDAQPGAVHITAAIGVSGGGHSSPWTISDAPGANAQAPMSTYFKRNGGSDSFQEVGSSPVVATVVAG